MLVESALSLTQDSIHHYLVRDTVVSLVQRLSKLSWDNWRVKITATPWWSCNYLKSLHRYQYCWHRNVDNPVTNADVYARKASINFCVAIYDKFSVPWPFIRWGLILIRRIISDPSHILKTSKAWTLVNFPTAIKVVTNAVKCAGLAQQAANFFSSSTYYNCLQHWS